MVKKLTHQGYNEKIIAFGDEKPVVITVHVPGKDPVIVNASEYFLAAYAGEELLLMGRHGKSLAVDIANHIIPTKY